MSTIKQVNIQTPLGETISKDIGADALNIDYNNSSSELESTNVQDAIDELKDDLSNLSSTLENLDDVNLSNLQNEQVIKYNSTSQKWENGNIDISGKADKVSNATNGNFASLDANGNLTDSGKKASDFAGTGTATSSANGLMSSTDKTKLDNLGTASTKDVPTSGNAGSTQVVMGNDTRLSDSRKASDVYDWAKAATKPTYTASEVGAIASTAKGANNGVAELDSAGKVPSSQLPSFVDDVLEYDSLSAFPTTGEAGKIYIAKDTNKTYRWSGTVYAEISPSLALGETSSTAYRGDRGKIAYDHSQSTHARTDATKVEASSTNGKIKINGTETTVYTHPGSGTNPHGTTKSDVGLGNVENFKAVSTVASQGLTDTEKSNARTNIGAGTGNSNLALGETSSTAYYGDKGKTAYTHSQTTSGNPHNVTKSDVGLGNVGNFKAVSTVASQGLSNTEKANARANIGAGTGNSNLTLGTSSTTAYRGDYGNSAYAHAVTNKGSAFSSGLYKITTNSEGHVTAATAVSKADITGLGIPGSDTNTTYAFATGDSNGQIKVTPSGGSAQNISVKGLGTAAYTSSDIYRKSLLKRFQNSGLTSGTWYKLFTVKYTSYNYLSFRMIVKTGYQPLCEALVSVRYIPTGVESGNSYMKIIPSGGSLDAVRMYQIDTQTIGIAAVVSGGTTDLGFEILDETSEGNTIPVSSFIISNPFEALSAAPTKFGVHHYITGSYTDLVNKPTIPSAATAAPGDITTGTASAGSSGNYARQDHTHKIGTATTAAYGATKLNTATNSTSTSEAATPSAVKTAYDLAASKASKPTVKSATLAANATSVTFTGIPTSGNNMIDFFITDGANYTAINTATSGQITLTYAASSSARTVYCRIEGV